jgi:hypothetical protein
MENGFVAQHEQIGKLIGKNKKVKFYFQILIDIKTSEVTADYADILLKKPNELLE